MFWGFDSLSPCSTPLWRMCVWHFERNEKRVAKTTTSNIRSIQTLTLSLSHTLANMTTGHGLFSHKQHNSCFAFIRIRSIRYGAAHCTRAFGSVGSYRRFVLIFGSVPRPSLSVQRRLSLSSSVFHSCFVILSLFSSLLHWVALCARCHGIGHRSSALWCFRENWMGIYALLSVGRHSIQHNISNHSLIK